MYEICQSHSARFSKDQGEAIVPLIVDTKNANNSTRCVYRLKGIIRLPLGNIQISVLISVTACLKKYEID
jgi:hypothetical protein